MTREVGSRRTSAWILPAEALLPRVFGLSGEERLRRVLARSGVTTIAVGDPPAAEPGESTLLVRADWLFDERLVAALLASEGVLLEARDGRPVAAHVPSALRDQARAVLRRGLSVDALPGGLRRLGPDELVPSYTHELRKREPALLAPLAGSRAAELERQLFDASYKGITDLVTKYVWPAPALPAVRACARAGISPNALTVVSWLLVVLAAVWFAQGRFGAGLAAAWLMTFLDTVDGKLARVTLRSSRIGHVLDHGLDIVHPPFWYAAFGFALPPAPWLAPAVVVAVVGYVVHRLVEGLFLALFKIEIHSWRAIDARFRLITTRRNPNLILLSAGWAAGRPELGFAALAVWTVASILFHLVRVAQAGIEVRRGGEIRGWYEADAPPGAAA